MLKSSLCCLSDAYILIKGTITISGEGADAAAVQERQKNKQVMYKSYKVIGIDLSKQQAPDANPKANQQTSFTGNLEQVGNTTTFFIIEEVKETKLGFLQGTVRVLGIYLLCKYCEIIALFEIITLTQYNRVNVKLFNSQLNK